MSFTTIKSVDSQYESGFLLLAGMLPPLAGAPPPLAGALPPLAGSIDKFIFDPSEVSFKPISNLFGNRNSAVILETYETQGKKFNIGYHHHNNFNTKPSDDGETGYGGYSILKVGSLQVKNTINGHFQANNFFENHAYKTESNWLTQKGNLNSERQFDKLLFNFNYSNSFNPKSIEKSNLLSLIGK